MSCFHHVGIFICFSLESPRVPGVLIQTTGKSIDRDTIDAPEIPFRSTLTFFAVVVQPVLNPANFLDPI